MLTAGSHPLGGSRTVAVSDEGSHPLGGSRPLGVSRSVAAHHHPHHHHHGNKFFWEPPRLRKENVEDEAEMHEDWLELTGDLILVACLFKLGSIIKYCGFDALWASIPVVLIVWRGLFGITQYFNAFESEAMSRKVALAGSLFGIYLMVLHLDEGDGECVVYQTYAEGFFYGYAISRLFLMFLFTVAAYHNPSRLAYIMRWVVPMSLGILLAGYFTFTADLEKASGEKPCLSGSASGPCLQAMAESGAAPAPGGEDEFVLASPRTLGWTYIFITFLELASYFEIWLWRQGWYAPPNFILVHIQHWVARRNIFLMVAIGESMLALLVEQFTIEAFLKQWVFLGNGFFICFGLALLNWNSQPHHIEDHVIRKNAKRNILQNYFYWALTWPVFVVGVALKLQLYLLAKEAKYAEEVVVVLDRRLAPGAGKPVWTGLSTVGLLGHSLAVSQLLLMLIDVAQRGERSWHSRQKKMKLAIRVVLALGNCAWYYFVLLTGTMQNNDEQLIKIGSGIHIIVCIAPAVLMELELYKVISGLFSVYAVEANHSAAFDRIGTLASKELRERAG